MKETLVCLVDDRVFSKMVDGNFVAPQHDEGYTEVYLDNFACTEMESKAWIATAVAVGIPVEHPCQTEVIVDDLFNGTRHLVLLIKGMIVWACKNICLVEWQIVCSPKLITLRNPRFVMRSFDDSGSGYYRGVSVSEELLRNARFDIMDIKLKDASERICRSNHLTERLPKDACFTAIIEFLGWHVEVKKSSVIRVQPGETYSDLVEKFWAYRNKKKEQS